MPTPKAINTQNVVRLFFVGEVQAHAVALSQRYQQLIVPYLELEKKLLSSAPSPYREWVAARQAIFEDGLTASKNHVALIQKIYSQCGLKAG